MNENYKSFFDKNANPESTDPYVAMGYKSPTNAQLRYDAVLNRLKGLDTTDKVVVDAGAGTGTMWTHYLEVHLATLQSLGLKKVILVDSCEPTMGFLHDAKNKLIAAGIDAEVVDGDFTTDLPQSDIIVSVGALNYYSFNQFIQILNEFGVKSNYAIVFETNVQSPHTSTDGGTWNPSFDVIYQYLYSEYLSNGKSRVNVEVLKKWTSVWSVTK